MYEYSWNKMFRRDVMTNYKKMSKWVSFLKIRLDNFD